MSTGLRSLVRRQKRLTRFRNRQRRRPCRQCLDRVQAYTRIAGNIATKATLHTPVTAGWCSLPCHLLSRKHIGPLKFAWYDQGMMAISCQFPRRHRPATWLNCCHTRLHPRNCTRSLQLITCDHGNCASKNFPTSSWARTV